jgi:tyrosinase
MTSPGDPIFYFHHAALDRLWWIWQMQDPDKRLNAIPTGTMPPMRRTRRADPTNRTVDMAVSSSF